MKSQNLRGRGKDQHSTLKTKFHAFPLRPHTRQLHLLTMTQPKARIRRSTTTARYYHHDSIPSLPTYSTHQGKPQPGVPRYRILQHSGVHSSHNPGEAFYHQSGQPLVHLQETTPVSSYLELVVCPPCLVQRLCHPWTELAEFPVSPAASARPWTSITIPLSSLRCLPRLQHLWRRQPHKSMTASNLPSTFHHKHSILKIRIPTTRG